jgi:hypothetical protein
VTPSKSWHIQSFDWFPPTNFSSNSFSTCRVQERIRIISWSCNRYCSCFMCTCCAVFAATPIERLPGRKGTRRQRWDWRHKYLTCLIVRVIALSIRLVWLILRFSFCNRTSRSGSPNWLFHVKTNQTCYQ